MKKIYWRPQSMPFFAFIIIAVFSATGLAAVEHFKFAVRKPFYQEKVAATKLAQSAMEAVKKEALARGMEIDPETDPAHTGLIGSAVTLVTSDAGDLEAKQTSANPNFAGVIVELMKRGKVKPGDTIAVSLSGSFPALNICVYAAITTLKLKPVIISSAASSQWGANDPDFLWIDMENLLQKDGIFPFRSVAASMGGRNDRAREMSVKGRTLIKTAIERNNLPLISLKKIQENIDERMSIYYAAAPPRLYINVGGGVAAVGPRTFKKSLKPGLILAEAPVEDKNDSVIRHFLKEDIPVIHIEDVKELARHYGLPVAPVSAPRIGQGKVFVEYRYNNWLAGGILLGIILGLYLFGRIDWGFRMLQTSMKREDGPPAPMV